MASINPWNDKAGLLLAAPYVVVTRLANVALYSVVFGPVEETYKLVMYS
jgi:hypothetical protein